MEKIIEYIIISNIKWYSSCKMFYIFFINFYKNVNMSLVWSPLILDLESQYNLVSDNNSIGEKSHMTPIEEFQIIYVAT